MAGAIKAVLHADVKVSGHRAIAVVNLQWDVLVVPTESLHASITLAWSGLVWCRHRFRIDTIVTTDSS